MLGDPVNLRAEMSKTPQDQIYDNGPSGKEREEGVETVKDVWRWVDGIRVDARIEYETLQEWLLLKILFKIDC
jgi:hypothetical protein